MRTLLVVASLLLTFPAQAGECSFKSADGWTFSVKDQSELEYWLADQSGKTTVCNWLRTDEGTGVRLACDDGTDEFVTPEDDRLTFGGRDYFKECPN